MSALAQPRYTPEEYLEMERAAPYKSEYYAGEIFAMAGASPMHNLIVMNVGAGLVPRLRGTPCATLASDMKVECGPSGLFSYPDVSVVCGEMRFHDDAEDMLTNPILLVEVLSPTTEAHDRGAKFAQYRRLESLREYVLVSQTEARVEVFTRGPEGRWTFVEAIGMDAECPLSSLGIALPLAEVYERVVFAPGAPRVRPSAPAAP